MEISCRGTLSQEKLKLKVEYDERFGTRILFFFESNRLALKLLLATGLDSSVWVPVHKPGGRVDFRGYQVHVQILYTRWRMLQLLGDISLLKQSLFSLHRTSFA